MRKEEPTPVPEIEPPVVVEIGGMPVESIGVIPESDEEDERG